VTTDPSTNTVSQWNDLSGNNNNFLQGGGAALEGQLVTNTWGDPVVRFNATDTVTNYMIVPAPATILGITGDMSVIAVVNARTLSNGRTGHIVSKTGPAGAPASNPQNIAGPYDCYLGSAGLTLYRGNANGTTAGINYGNFTAASGPVVGYPSVVAASDTGNTISQFLNGQAVGTGLLSSGFLESNDLDQGQQVYIGARAAGFNRLAGDLAELIVASSPISASDSTALANYLSARHHFVLFNPNPTNIVASYSNGQITLSWPADHTGWTLQSNSIALTTPSAWYPVPGSTGTNQFVVTPDPAKHSVFYRMFFQQP